MQVPSLRFFCIFRRSLGGRIVDPLFSIIFGTILAPFGGPKISYFGVIFWTPQKVGSKDEKDGTAQFRGARRAPRNSAGESPLILWGQPLPGQIPCATITPPQVHF